MFQRILIPLDGSETAEIVLPYLGHFVSPANTQVVLVRVLETRRYAPSRYEPLPMDYFAVIHQEYEVYLQKISVQLQAEGYQVVSITAEGDAATEILKIAQERGVELIAMTTNGRSGVSRWILGSVAERVLQGASLPVLLVSDQTRAIYGGLRQILVPLDGSALAEQAVPYAQELAEATGAKLFLFAVLSTAEIEMEVSRWPPDAEADPLYGHRVTLARNYLVNLAQRMQKGGIDCSYRVVCGDPGTAICNSARRGQADLVVMSTHGHSGLSRWVLGSVTNQVVRGVSCPVLVVRNLPT